MTSARLRCLRYDRSLPPEHSVTHIVSSQVLRNPHQVELTTTTRKRLHTPVPRSNLLTKLSALVGPKLPSYHSEAAVETSRHFPLLKEILSHATAERFAILDIGVGDGSVRAQAIDKALLHTAIKGSIRPQCFDASEIDNTLDRSYCPLHGPSSRHPNDPLSPR